jgi:hypothetical protein
MLPECSRMLKNSYADRCECSGKHVTDYTYADAVEHAALYKCGSDSSSLVEHQLVE